MKKDPKDPKDPEKMLMEMVGLCRRGLRDSSCLLEVEGADEVWRRGQRPSAPCERHAAANQRTHNSQTH